MGANTCAGLMGTHFLPQVLAKSGQISQSARSWQRTFLRRASAAMSLCRCPLDPLLGLLSAHDASPDQWSSFVLCDLRAIAVSEFGQKARLGEPFDAWRRAAHPARVT